MPSARVTAEAVHLPPEWDAVLDVLFDEQRVFAILPERHPVGEDGLRRVEWHPVLRSFLRGASTITLRTHLDGTVLFRGDVVFGDGSERVRFLDSEGYPLAMNKWGGLERPFESGSPESELLLADLQELLRVINEDLGRPAFLAYGTLLGAVRSGKFIGHDTDADIAVYSRHENPADIARESFLVQRHLSRLGWRSRRQSGAFVQVWNGQDASDLRKIDIFTAYHVDDWLAVNRWVRAKVPRQAMLPLGEVALEGRTFPAPHDPDALLAATYGPTWRVPDPTFRFRLTPAMRRRADGWFGWHRLDHGRWRHGVADAPHREAEVPSSFARFVASRQPASSVLVDVGSGEGHDAVWFAQQGHEVLGLDYRPNVVHKGARRAAAAQVDARFEHMSLYDVRAALALAGKLACGSPPTLYARNLVEALRPVGRSNLWLMGKTALTGGGAMYLEFRTDRAADGSVQEVRRPWLRTFSPDELAGEINARGGSVTHQELVQDTHGQSCRMTVTWAR